MKTGLLGWIRVFVLFCLVVGVGGCGLGGDDQVMEE